eukprot:TRINITY_DN9666_c0_g1_i1.p1 TRINITY_DN9666_c0_g1~~TRINITY_DN9666_c0_g1_i1.p1  ORF type:complete len:571 (+),score=130.43 TRINITY_DN9666_c0_g1_i1:64-1776(+)
MCIRDSPYTVLNLPPTCSYHELKERFHEQSKIFHPDKQSLEHQGMANEYFGRLEHAFKKVSTPFRRWLYDHFGEVALDLRHMYAESLDDEEIVYNSLANEAERDPSEQNIRRLEEKRAELERKITYLYTISQEKLYYKKRVVRLIFRFGINASEFLNEGYSALNFEPSYIHFSSSIFGNGRFGVSSAKHGNNIIGNILYQHDFRFERHRDLSMKLEANYGNRQGIITLLTKKKMGKFTLEVTTAVNHRGAIFPSFFLERSNKTSTFGGGLNYHGSLAFRLHSVQLMRKRGLKVENEAIVTDNGITYSLNLVKSIAPKIHGTLSINTGLQKDYDDLKFIPPTISYGIRFDVSRSKSIEVTGYSSLSEIGINLKADRYGLNIELPIIIANGFSNEWTALSFCCTATVGWLLYSYSRREERKKRMKNREESEGKSNRDNFVALLDLITFHVDEILAYEEARNGLLITESYFGSIEAVKARLNGDQAARVLETSMVVQALVTNSRLFLHFDKFLRIPGIFLPEYTERPALAVRYTLSGIPGEFILTKGKKQEVGVFPKRNKWLSLVDLCLKMPL